LGGDSAGAAGLQFFGLQKEKSVQCPYCSYREKNKGIKNFFFNIKSTYSQPQFIFLLIHMWKKIDNLKAWDK